MPTTPFTLRLDVDLKKKLEAEAKLEDRSTSYLAAKAIEELVQSRTRKRTEIAAALDEADKGEFISEHEMTKWVDSWTDNTKDASASSPSVDIRIK